MIGRGAFLTGRSLTVRIGGLLRSDYAGMSSDKMGGNPIRQKPKVSRGRFVRPGLVGPKPRPVRRR